MHTDCVNVKAVCKHWKKNIKLCNIIYICGTGFQNTMIPPIYFKHHTIIDMNSVLNFIDKSVKIIDSKFTCWIYDKQWRVGY